VGKILVLGVLGFSLLPLESLRAECPEWPPHEAVFIGSACGWTSACPNSPLVLRLEPQQSGGFPPAEFDPGYTIQECDTVAWDFGDGTTQTVAGSAEVSHTYAMPGNYAIGVRITNSLGEASVTDAQALVVANAPSRVEFVTPGVGYPFFGCATCVLAHEGDGFVDITLRRSLDLSRQIAVRARALGLRQNDQGVEALITFGPGEVEKVFHVPIPDDDLYSGPLWFPLQFLSATGGVLVDNSGNPGPTLFLAEDEPQPVCSIGAGVSVVEGDSGRTSFSVPVQLSAPLAHDVPVEVFYIHQTAVENDFVRGGSVWLRAGQTSFAVTGWIAGDRVVEEDETFIVRLFPLHTTGDPSFAQTDATITIINDDVAAAQLAPIPTLSWAGYSLFILAMVAAAYVALRR
jgi:PKD repeat protein